MKNIKQLTSEEWLHFQEKCLDKRYITEESYIEKEGLTKDNYYAFLKFNRRVDENYNHFEFNFKPIKDFKYGNLVLANDIIYIDTKYWDHVFGDPKHQKSLEYYRNQSRLETETVSETVIDERTLNSYINKFVELCNDNKAVKFIGKPGSSKQKVGKIYPIGSRIQYNHFEYVVADLIYALENNTDYKVRVIDSPDIIAQIDAYCDRITIKQTECSGLIAKLSQLPVDQLRLLRKLPEENRKLILDLI